MATRHPTVTAVPPSGPPYARFPRRVLAGAVDTVVIVLLVALDFWVLGAVQGIPGLPPAVLLGLIPVALLYEPVLVSRTGGSLGHHALNLRVVADEHGGNLPFLRALGRTLIKLLLGWLSFLWMAATRRHQALHDLATRSTVQIRNLTKARPWEYTTERYEPPHEARASRLRRVLVIVGYALVVLVLVMTALELWISESCLDGEACTPTEELISAVGSVVWLGATATVVALGWRGTLPGSRRRKDRRKP